MQPSTLPKFLDFVDAMTRFYLNFLSFKSWGLLHTYTPGHCVPASISKKHMVYSNAFLIFPFNYSLRCGAFWATKSARLGVTVPLAHLKPKIDSALLTGERAGHVTKFSELAALSDCITSLHYF